MTRQDDITRLGELEIVFAAAGGRGVDLAEEIDELRARLTPKVFYRRVIQVEILSEEPYDQDDLTQIGNDIIEGDLSGYVTEISTENVDGPAMAQLLIKQGSDPEFFRLDDEGNTIDAGDYY